MAGALRSCPRLGSASQGRLRARQRDARVSSGGGISLAVRPSRILNKTIATENTGVTEITEKRPTLISGP
jgi:hypothetical protein